MKKWPSKLRVCSLALVMLWSIVFPLLASPEAAYAASQTSFYVSPAGNDANPGTVDLPFATIERARDAVRNVNSAMTGDIVVYLRGGQYEVDATIVFNESDSGTNGHTVIYRNYPGEEPVIVGGTTVTGWQPYQGGIYKAELGAGAPFYALYEGGTRSVMARYPNEGYHTVAGMHETSPRSSFYYAQGDVPVIGNIADLQVYVWPGGSSGTYNWHSETTGVTALDPEQRLITLKRSTTYNMGAGSRYYLQGALELLDQPGEFYLDRTTNVLYYWPRGQSLDDIVIPKIRRIFELKGSSESNRISNIRFEGIEVQATDALEQINTGTEDGAFYLENADHITITKSKIHDTGLHGFYLRGYAQDIVISGNLIYNIGFAGVKISGLKSSAYTSKHNRVENNLIYSVGRLQGSGSGITLGLSGDNVIAHNRLYDLPRFGISFSTGWYSTYLGQTIDGILVTEDNLFDFLHTRNNVIEFNDISDGMNDSEDGGLIYSAGTGMGNIVRNNHLHDSDIGVLFGMGIYMDRNSDYVTVTKNLISNMQLQGSTKLRSAIWQAGQNAVVANNIVASSKVENNGGVVGTYDLDENLTVERNIFYDFGSLGGGIYTFNKWNNAVIQSADYNLFFNSNGSYEIKGWPMGKQLAEWQSLYDQHSITADPGFIDTANGDYRLKYDSPAYSQGFEDIDYEHIGLLADFPFADPADPLERLFVKEEDRYSTINLGTSEQRQLQVTGRTAQGYAADLSNASFHYASGNEAVAAVDGNGIVTGVAPGVAEISVTATAGGVARSTAIYVIVDDQLDHVAVRAAKTTLLQGETLPLQAVATSVYGQYYSAAGLNVEYSSSDGNVATVDSAGTVAAQGLGTAQITVVVTKDGITRQAAIEVKVASRVLSQVSAALEDQSPAVGFIQKGASLPLIVTATMSDGQPANQSEVEITYESSNPGVATVNAAGQVQALLEGKTNIFVTAKVDGVSAVHVLPVAVVVADQVPAPWQVQRYGTAGGYVVHADGEYTVMSNGANVWGAADDFIYTYQDVELPEDAAAVSLTARIQSLENTNTSAAAGLMFRDNDTPGAKNVMLRVTPGGSLQMTYREQQGGTTQYVAGKILTYPAEIKLAREGDRFISYYKENGVWNRYNVISTVLLSEQFLAGTGVYAITEVPTLAVLDNVELETEELFLSRLEVTADKASLGAGDTAQLTVAGYAGEFTPVDLSGVPVTYASSNPALATVDANGVVTGVSDGNVQITVQATVNGATASGSVTLVIATPKLAQVDLSATATGMGIGQSYPLSVRGVLENGADANISVASVVYTSSNPAVVEADASGLLTAQALGVAKITVQVTLDSTSISKEIMVVVHNGTVFQEGFEEGMGNWTVETGLPSAAVTERPRSGAYSFKLDQDIQSIAVTLPQSTRGIVEAWFYDSGAPGLSGGFALQSDYFAGLYNTFSGTHYMERYGSYYNLTAAREEGWHQIMYDLYSDAGMVNIYIDGVLARQRVMNGFTKLQIKDIWGGKISNLYFDDITVYRMDPN